MSLKYIPVYRPCLGGTVLHLTYLKTVLIQHHKPRLRGDSDPDPDPDLLRLHGGKLDSNPDSDHLSHVDCDPDSKPDSGPGARVNAAIDFS